MTIYQTPNELNSFQLNTIIGRLIVFENAINQHKDSDYLQFENMIWKLRCVTIIRYDVILTNTVNWSMKFIIEYFYLAML